MGSCSSSSSRSTQAFSGEETQSTASDACDMQKSSHRRDLEILGAVFSDRRMEVRN